MTSRDLRNTVLTAAGEGLWGLQTNMIASATVLTVLLKAYGASSRLIGAVAAIEAGAVLLPQLLGAYIFTSRRHLKRNMILWHYIVMLPFLLLMGLATIFAPAMPPALYRLLMLIGLGIFSTGVGITLATWMDWMAQIFDEGIRGTALGISMCSSAILGTGGALVAGWIIGHMEQPLSYGILYIVAYIVAMASISTFGFISDPAEHADEVRSVPRTRDILTRFLDSLKDANLRQYLAGRGLAICGFSVMNFIAVHYASQKGGSLSGSAIVSCGAAMTAGMAAGNLLLGRLGDKHGHRMGVLIGVATQMVSLVIMILLPGPVGCMLAYLTAGFSSQGTWVSHWNLVVEYCPHDMRTVHISACNMIVGLFSVVMPVLAGMAADWWGTTDLFIVSAALSAAAFLWFVLRVKDPRDRALV